jgi:thioredoxin 1
MGIMGNVIEVTDATFEQEVLKSELPVLVDFWSPGCPPCVRLAPVIEKLAGEMADKVKFVKVNAGQEFQTAMKYRIQAVPTLFVFKGGEVSQNTVGFHTEEELRQLLASVSG